MISVNGPSQPMPLNLGPQDKPPPLTPGTTTESETGDINAFRPFKVLLT